MSMILVIEDETTIRENLVELLSAEGFDVLAAEDGDAGVKVALATCPDLILCDVRMPRLDGHGVLARVRSDAALSSVPFVFLTARGAREDMRAGMELGADDYIVKPFTRAELLGAVRARLRRHDPAASPAAAARESNPTKLVAGAVVAGDYRLEAPLGEGGMGVVWRAVDLRLDRVVALKFLRPVFHHDAAQLDRFVREASILASLDHPGVVPVYRALPVTVANQPSFCIVMPLVRGTTLAEHLAAVGTLAPAEAVAIARALLEVLCAAHAAGVVHRDVKPANVMLGPGEGGRVQVRLLDFGVAKSFVASGGARDPLTHAGTILGTIEYMSPEQILDASTVDARADVWAVAACLFEMLTGALPFAARSPLEAISRVLTTRADRASSHAPWLPAAYDAFFARALARDIDARPDDARALLRELDALPVGGGAVAQDAPGPSPIGPTLVFDGRGWRAPSGGGGRE